MCNIGKETKMNQLRSLDPNATPLPGKTPKNLFATPTTQERLDRRVGSNPHRDDTDIATDAQAVLEAVIFKRKMKCLPKNRPCGTMKSEKFRKKR